MLEQFGSVQAIEMSDLARQIAWEKSGREFLYGYLPDSIPVAPESADLIVLFDVLEHVEQDEASLVAMRRLLKPGGRIVLTVPAHQWLWSAHDVGLHHMRRYSRSLLRERIEKAGYRSRQADLYQRRAVAGGYFGPASRQAPRLRRSLGSGNAA